MSAHPHYAHAIPFAQLLAELEAARAQKLVYSRTDGSLQLWCYTAKAVYDKAWTPAVEAARGLVLDLQRRLIVATPFPKFFNIGEAGVAVPDESFEVFEKVDGSLIILFHDGKQWRTATKGALDSPQALWAAERLSMADLSSLELGTTYLAEAIYPENRIVVRYAESGLVLLAAYDAKGVEYSAQGVTVAAKQLGWRVAKRESFGSMADLLVRAEKLTANEEGFVLRFTSGLRLKLKGSAYARLHALIAGVTPLGLWELLAAEKDIEMVRREIPEEFWWDFDEIRRLLEERLEARLAAVRQLAAEVALLSDKELGLRLGGVPKDTARYLFGYRRSPDLRSDRRAMQNLLRDIRPQGNVLPGYRPSYAVQHVMDDG